MIQETRKDPRAKVLSMTVRYKSANVDEFIEHHSHDVSRGGMFIKTPSPFPAGTLLKFEVRIAEEQKVMQGVGRVVWKRESTTGSESPSGMGVKFIKLDDDSKHVIDRLVGSRGEKEGTFDAGERANSMAAPAPTPAPAPAESKPIPMRKGTMIGLGAVKVPDAPAAGAAATPSGGFFPDSAPAEQPAPEDRTVMRQAAELLREALREAGSSMEEIGATGAAPVVTAPAVETPPGAVAKIASPSPPDVAPPMGKSTPPAATSTPAAPDAPVRKAASERPVAARPAPVSQPPVESIRVPKRSAGPMIWVVLGAAAVAGGIFYFSQPNKSDQAAPAATAAPTTVTTAAPTETALPAVSAAASAEPAASAAAPASAAPIASTAPPESAAQKAADAKAEAEAKKAEIATAKQAAADERKAAAEAKKAAAEQAAQDRKAAHDAARAAAAAHAAAVMKAPSTERASPPELRPVAPKAPAAPRPAPKPADDNPY